MHTPHEYAVAEPLAQVRVGSVGTREVQNTTRTHFADTSRSITSFKGHIHSVQNSIPGSKSASPLL